ncbi:flagellar biosynthesis regulator FlaF [Kordiimonas aquimaris]|uniref:flagellar biosynthesis regulator FlaF n=1 Tax=Kordiimonas aquimaris TaxID=707591 RepID=UPI0021CF162F|nr:flagellar biosynthesis regulator FlaF [Kordiimonas aquimaris]
MSYQAYKKAQTTTETSSQIEYRLFAQVTNALMSVKDLECTDKRTIEALDWNRRMWSVFSSDCGAKGNGLPDDLRASIISLSIWASKHTSLVMRGQGKVEALIDVNKMIMDGLADQAKLQANSSNASQPETAADTRGQENSRSNNQTNINTAINAVL